MGNEQTVPLRRDSLDIDPIKQFASWLLDAEQADLPQPNAMTLATSSQQGTPAARIVLLRGFDESGFVFFTNYQSRKAHDLRENPAAALLFSWLPLSRQIRIEGRVELLAEKNSDLYFASRPRGHQIAAQASPQSQVIPDRSFLDEQFKNLGNRFEGKDVLRPQHWGGYRVIPEALEFWQERENRLHDRLRYRRDTVGNWVIERLAP